MPPAIIAGAIGAAGNLGSSLIGNAAAGSDRDKARAAQQAALQNILGINVPTADEMKVALAKYQQTGQMTPELENAINQGPSKMENIQLDPRLKGAQMDALSSLQGIGKGGLQPEDLAALRQISGGVDRDSQARNAAMLQNMASRGVAGGGAELAAALSGNQAATQRASDQSMNVAGSAQARALQALSQAGALSGQLRSQDFGEQAQVANASDLINRFNTQNQQSVQNQNVNRRNQAQQYNLQEAQNIANQNVGLSNQEQMYNKSALQQQFANQLAKGQAAAGQNTQIGNFYGQQAANTAAMGAGIGKAIGGAAGAAGQYFGNQDFAKTLAAGKTGKTPADDDNAQDGE